MMSEKCVNDERLITWQILFVTLTIFQARTVCGIMQAAMSLLIGSAFSCIITFLWGREKEIEKKKAMSK